MIDCPQCDAYRRRHGNSAVRSAAASAGIEHGLSTQEALDLLLAQYHAGGHEFARAHPKMTAVQEEDR